MSELRENRGSWGNAERIVGVRGVKCIERGSGELRELNQLREIEGVVGVRLRESE